MSVKLLTEHHLELLNLKKGCTGWSESTLVKMPHRWKSRHGWYTFDTGAEKQLLSDPTDHNFSFTHFDDQFNSFDIGYGGWGTCTLRAPSYSQFK